MWILRKKSRNDLVPYSGISCDSAGVPKGKLYLDKDDAENDAKKLNAVNKVGWDVVEVHLLEAHGDFDNSISYEVERAFNARFPKK